MNLLNNPDDRALSESEQIINGLILLCKNGYCCVRSGPGYIVSGGPVLKPIHLALENLGWYFCKNRSRWEFPIFAADYPPEPRNAGGDGEPA